MSDDDKTPPAPRERIQKGGYQPANEGYQPGDNRGYSPSSSIQPVSVPTPPTTGGTGTVKPTASSDKKD